MQIFREVTTIFDVFLILAIYFFSNGVKDKASEIGFGAMALLITINILLIWS